MSTTVTGSPPQGQVTSHRRGPGAQAAPRAFTGLEAGIIVLALAMAAGCGWGLTRCLAEYR
jgi:hypothetical protein